MVSFGVLPEPELYFIFIFFIVSLPPSQSWLCLYSLNEADNEARRHDPVAPLTTTTTSRLPSTRMMMHEHATQAETEESGQRTANLLCPSPNSAASSLMLQPSPTASRRISTGSTFLQAVAAGSSMGGSRPPSPNSGDDAGYSPDPGAISATPTPEPLSSGGGISGGASSGGGKDDASSIAKRKKKRRKMPIINPLVTLPMWPSK